MYKIKSYWSDEADANITLNTSIQVTEEESASDTGLVDQYDVPIYRYIDKVICGYIK